ncbi:hypothetical protein C1646_661203 [Rhizophagus diaphanus]|nr:hypothetical protein C1646_661203 [Rhizophagus diaphanus] [Rhizophagus sp. MUCL 43196]
MVEGYVNICVRSQLKRHELEETGLISILNDDLFVKLCQAYEEELNVSEYLTSRKVKYYKRRRNPPVSNEIEQIFNERNYDRESFISLFSKTFVLAYEKCEKHISSNHSALPLFRVIQCFDPRFIQSNTAHHNMGDYRIIEEFQFPMDILIQK